MSKAIQTKQQYTKQALQTVNKTIHISINNKQHKTTHINKYINTKPQKHNTVHINHKQNNQHRR